MNIFSEEKYGPTKFCEACFKEFDVSYRKCPGCRRSASFDSVNAVGNAKVRFAINCFVFAVIAFLVLAVYAWNVGLAKALGSTLSVLLSFFAVAMLSKGLVFYVFGRRIIRKNFLDDEENKLFFIVEMVGLGLSLIGALIWSYVLFQQTKH